MRFDLVEQSRDDRVLVAEGLEHTGELGVLLVEVREQGVVFHGVVGVQLGAEGDAPRAQC